jgi:threonine/homoserine/homoserine lactone efflux protein
MRFTLFGAVALAGFAALLLYVGYELCRTSQANASQPPQNPDPSTNR